MNITLIELRTLKRLLTNEDLLDIANKTKMSKSAVNAVFYTRPNNAIETEIVHLAKDKIENYHNLIYKIVSKNKVDESLTVEEYNKQKTYATWKTGSDYYLMIDCYLQMSHIKFKDIDSLHQQIKLEFKELQNYKYRIIDIIHRLLGVPVEQIIKAV